MSSAFVIKSARIEALSIVLKDGNVNTLNADLQTNAANLSQFQNMPFLLDVHLLPDPWGLDIKEVVRCFSAIQVHIIGVRHTDADYAAKVAQYNLAFSLLLKDKEPIASQTKPETQSPTLQKQPQSNIQQEQLQRLKEQIVQLKQQTQELRQQLQYTIQSEPAKPKQPVQCNLPTSSPTITIDKPVRSGQQIYAEGGDVICTALVSQGAEIIADGNIHIYAPFRGRALAGASGDKNARIFIHSMQGQLVSIAGIYRVFDKELPASLYGKSVVVSLDGGKLNITALSGIS